MEGGGLLAWAYNYIWSGLLADYLQTPTAPICWTFIGWNVMGTFTHFTHTPL